MHGKKRKKNLFKGYLTPVDSGCNGTWMGGGVVMGKWHDSFARKVHFVECN